MNVTPARCSASKRGRFNVLVCCLERGHWGPHNFVVSGVTEFRPNRKMAEQAREGWKKRRHHEG